VRSIACERLEHVQAGRPARWQLGRDHARQRRDEQQDDPARTCSSVDLPDPEGPMIAAKRPLGKSTLTPASASTATSPSPKRRLRSWASTISVGSLPSRVSSIASQSKGTPGTVCSIVRPMHETTPGVFLIARPSIDIEGMRGYLRDVGGESWLERRLGETTAASAGAKGAHDRLNAGEMLVEFGGRACYRSWEPGLNPNVTKVRTDQREYFANILRSAHGSVLEHANYSFALRNCSRIFTHELVRHRAGSAFSQESLRYVRLTDIGFRVPPALEPVREQVLSIVEQLEEFQLSAAKELGIDEEGVPFHVKKEVTSALRRLAPTGLSTDIIWTANARTLRHVIEMRTAAGAEEELRLVFDKIARVMLAEAPSLFQDFARQDDGSWVPEHRKV
jgi:thymidylate synthase (FAD)